MLPGIAGGIMAAFAAGTSGSFIGVETSFTGSSNVLTLASVDLGSASDIKVINVHWIRAGVVAGSLDSATVDGQSATIIAQDSHSGGATGLGSAVIIADVSSSSGDVVLTFDIDMSPSAVVPYIALGVFNSVGRDDTTNYDQAEVRGSNDTSVSGTVGTAAGGWILLCGTGSTNTEPYGMAFTGADEVYDDNDGGAFNGRYGGAMRNNTTLNASHAIGLTMTDGSGDVDDAGVELVAVTFEPA